MTFRFGAVSALSLTAIVLVACGGKTISIGSEDSAETVVPSAVTVATSECSQGYEHANICCTGGGNGSEPTCRSYPDDPFHPCDSGWTTYPSSATCCSLDNPSDCTGSCGNDSVGNAGECQIPPTSITASEDGGYEVDAGVTTFCESRCPPGYTGISPYDENGCCQTGSDGQSVCFGEAVAYADASVPEDASSVPPLLLPDGGEYDAGTATIDAGESVPPPDGISACSFDCPDGWFVADAVEGLCCNNTSSGAEECFAAVFPEDNGGGSGSGSGSSSGGDSPGAGPPSTDASATPSH